MVSMVEDLLPKIRRIMDEESVSFIARRLAGQRRQSLFLELIPEGGGWFVIEYRLPAIGVPSDEMIKAHL